MKNIVSAQHAYFATGSTKDVKFRIEQLTKLESLLKNNEELLNKAIYDDFKKSSFENYLTELSLLYHDIKEAKRNLYRWARRQKVSTNVANFPAKSYIVPEPLGVCLVIGAWNYPYQLSLAPAVAALAAGNTVIIKPSELPNNTAQAMATLINKNFPADYFHVVQGGVPETTELLKQQFDKIFFTGSTKVGKIVYKAAAENLTPVTLEMGGKSPAFVTKDCNLKITVKRMIWAKFLNAGQTCIAPDYVLIDKHIESEFLELAKKEIIETKYAYENDNYLQIINTDNLERLEKMLDPDKIYFGGEVHKETRYMQPTLMHKVTFNDAVMQEEIFGPILPVISYTTLDEAIAEVNKHSKPLSCYAFTNEKKSKTKILENISFGGGAINEAVMHITNPKLPFGGVGKSGIGSYHGKAGFDCFTHYKSILDKPTWLELPIKYSPHSNTKLKWLKRLFKLQ